MCFTVQIRRCRVVVCSLVWHHCVVNVKRVFGDWLLHHNDIFVNKSFLVIFVFLGVQYTIFIRDKVDIFQIGTLVVHLVHDFIITNEISTIIKITQVPRELT